MEYYKQQVIYFIVKNGWKKCGENEDYINFIKENNIGIDIADDEVVLIGDNGDFLHFELNNMSVYALLGYLLNYRYISYDYQF